MYCLCHLLNCVVSLQRVGYVPVFLSGMALFLSCFFRDLSCAKIIAFISHVGGLLYESK